MIVVSCRAPYGKGGLGQHFAQVVEEARATGELAAYYSIDCKPGDEAIGQVVQLPLLRPFLEYTPLRFNQAGKYHLSGDLFDRVVARRLQTRTDGFLAFTGKALHSFRKARRLGVELLGVHVGNSHVHTIRQRHEAAFAQWGMRETWLNEAAIRKALAEYEAADRIYVNSRYTATSFLEAGVAASKLVLFPLKPLPRFVPPPTRPDDGIFRVVYAGSITVPKGIPVLLEAFARLPVKAAVLRLMGGWTSRAMGRYIKGWMARDPRIQVGPGDPLPAFQQANVCVHPSYEDGFAYAPAEALACGTPVIVTADTGMKDLVREGENGFVVPTGDVDALYERLLYFVQHR
jgi:glycosyltransferase involved in cell wall biosynthesis